MEFNMNQDKRDNIIFNGKVDYSGGICSFNNMDYETLEKLVALKFADPEDAQNSAPTLLEFLTFMKKHPCFLAHGYVVESKRSDYRVSIEGLQGATNNQEELKSFREFNKYADERVARKGYQWSWWD